MRPERASYRSSIGCGPTSRVEATRDKISPAESLQREVPQALQRRLLGGEMPSGSEGAPVSGVEGFDRVGRADHGADLKDRSPGTE